MILWVYISGQFRLEEYVAHCEAVFVDANLMVNLMAGICLSGLDMVYNFRLCVFQFGKWWYMHLSSWCQENTWTARQVQHTTGPILLSLYQRTIWPASAVLCHHSFFSLPYIQLAFYVFILDWPVICQALYSYHTWCTQLWLSGQCITCLTGSNTTLRLRQSHQHSCYILHQTSKVKHQIQVPSR